MRAVISRLLPRRQQFIHFSHHGEGVSHVKHVGFAAGPAAVRVQADGAALGDETPADGVRLFAVATGAQPLRMPRRCAGLANLVQVRQKRQHRLSLAALVHQRFAAAQRRAAELEKTPDVLFRLGHVRLAVGLFLRPARAGDKK